MKRLLGFVFSFFISTISYCQLGTYWPHTFSYPICSTMTAPTNCTKVALGGNWNVAGTWSPSGVPTNNDIVCIPANVTVNITNQVYSPLGNNEICGQDPSNTPRLKIFVCGTLLFDQNGKLYLDCFSFLQVYTNGTIVPPSNNGSADLIQIGDKTVWGGPNSGNQGIVNGPFILSWPYIGNGVLPVAFDFFKAQQKSPFNITLDWGTLQEVNNTNFIIERSTDQKAFSALGSVKSAGTSYSRNTYSFIDKTPASGNNYYRLKQVDENGNISYSETVRVLNQVKKNISLFPNPVTALAQLYSKTNFEKSQSIEIINSKGTRIKSIVTNGSNTIQIDMSSLLPGLYLLRVTDNGNVVEHISFIKQ